MSYLQNSLALDSSQYEAELYLIGRQKLAEAPQAVRYAMLRALARPNGLYADVGRALRDGGEWQAAMKPLAQPTSTVVRFYGAKLLAGAPIEIEAENDRIIEPLEQFYRWSNLDAHRAMMGRQLACLGDQFLKVVRKLGPAGKMTSVYLEILDPATVRDFDVDERGFVTWIRIDVPRSRRETDGTLTNYVHIEVWSKAEGTYRRWEADSRRGNLSLLAPDELDQLGTPTEETTLAQMGIDFCPLVHVPFERQDDSQWGNAAVWDQIEKLVELDLIVTELHRKMFNYGVPDMMLTAAGVTNSQGNPVPAPDFSEIADVNGKDALVVGRERVYTVPAPWKLEYMTANLDWANARQMVLDHYTRIERALPELLYGRLSELGGELSGRALRYMMIPAIDRVLEVRANQEHGLARAGMMALTIGAFGGLFKDLGGTFDSGAFKHSFADRDVIPVDSLESAQEELARGQAFTTATGQTLPMIEGLRRIYNLGDEAAAELMTAAAGEVDNGETQAIEQ